MAKHHKIGILLAVMALLFCAFAVGCNSGGNEGRFTVTFLLENDQVYAQKTVKQNKKISMPANPEKSGYDFVEWRLGDGGYDFSLPVTGDITLVAGWSATQYSITYKNVGEALNDNPLTYTVESPKITFNPLSQRDKVFLGWDIAGIDAGSVGDVTATAKWGVTVTFDTDGGTEIPPVTVEEGSLITPPSIPQKPQRENDKIVIDYTFLYWKLNGQRFDFSIPVSYNIILTACYETYLSIK